METSENKLPKSSIQHRGLPVELMNELFASMPLGNAFGLLAKMPNGLFAKNVLKMINGIKEAMKNNKLNIEDCGPRLIISEEGLIAKHSRAFGKIIEWNCVRAVFSIPSLNSTDLIKPKIMHYFEMEILNEFADIAIGFCCKLLSLENKWLGLWKHSNSIGICCKMGIWIDDGSHIKFENDNANFKKGDIVGIGIILQPNAEMECFATLNGQLLGKGKLLSKFSALKLFPAVTLADSDQSIRLNFGKENWQFKKFEYVLNGI